MIILLFSKYFGDEIHWDVAALMHEMWGSLSELLCGR